MRGVYSGLLSPSYKAGSPHENRRLEGGSPLPPLRRSGTTALQNHTMHEKRRLEGGSPLPPLRRSRTTILQNPVSDQTSGNLSHMDRRATK